MKVLNSGILFLYFGAAYGFFQPNRIKQIHTKQMGFKNTQYGKMESMPLDKLYQGIENSEINNIYFSEDLKEIYVIDKDETNPDFPMIQNMQVVNSNPILADKIVELSSKNKVHTVIMEPQNTFLNDVVRVASNSFEFVVISIILTSVIQGIVGFTRRGGGNSGPMNMGFPFFNKDKRVDKTVLNVSLSDWAGSPEVFEECAEIVSYIKNNTVYKNAGADIPKGILLEGPPGTGKTLIAKAIAKETNATFLSASASEFVELFVGMGAAKIRDLFAQARVSVEEQNTPAIIFIDEIDAVGRQRGSSNLMGGNEEREQTLNQLLSEMDGFLPNTNIIVIAATNRKDILDSALLRPGRFDRIIYVPLPDRKSREDILKLYMKSKNMEKGISLDYLAEMTTGFSGAQLKNLLNEAAINAARSGTTIITQVNLEDALEKIVIGITKKTDTRSDEARYRVAVHEMGHAVLAAQYKDDFELLKVSMKSTYGGVGGYTLFNEKQSKSDDGNMYTKDVLKKRLSIALAGKAAEYIYYGEDLISLGAIEDLKQANDLARRMIGNYGMGKELELFYNKNNDNQGFSKEKYSEKTTETYDKEIMNLLEEAYDMAKTTILDNKETIDSLVQVLLSENVLSGFRVYRCL
jgi:cell division protease FtsH